MLTKFSKLYDESLTHMDSTAKNGGILGDEGAGPKARILFRDGINAEGTSASIKVVDISQEPRSVHICRVFNDLMVNDDCFTCAIHTVSPKAGLDWMSTGFTRKILA